MVNNIHILLFTILSIVVYPQKNKNNFFGLIEYINVGVNDTVRINKLFDISENYSSTKNIKIDSISNLILQLSRKNNFQKGFGYYYLIKGKILMKKENYEDYNKALSNFKIASSYFSKLKNRSLFLNSQHYVSFSYYYIGKPEIGNKIAIYYLKKYNKSNYFKQLSSFNLFMGICQFKDIADANESINYLIKANYYARKSNDSKAIINCYNFITFIYCLQENWEKALYYSKLWENSIDLAEKKVAIPIDYIRAMNLSYLAKSNHYLKHYKTSLLQSKKELAIVLKNKLDPFLKENLILIALNYYNVADYNLAIEYAKKTIEKYPESEFITNHIMGKCYYKLHNYKKAQNILEATIKKYPELASTDLNIGPYTIYKDLSDVCTALKEYQSANSYLKLYTENKISLLELKIKKNSNKLSELFNSINLEYENKQLFESKKEKELELSNQKNRNLFTSITIVFIVFIILIILFFYFKIKSKNKLLNDGKNKIEVAAKSLKESLTKKEILLKEIHHRVKNNLQLIISFQNIMIRRNKQGSVSDFLATGQSRINAMALIHDSLYQHENIENVDIREYIQKLITHIQEIENNKNVAINIFINSIYFSIDTAVPLGLIINELLTNSFKHGFPNNREGIINIIIKQNSNDFLLIYNDNGIPFENERVNKKNFGIELVHLLSKQLKGDLTSFSKERKEYLIQFTDIEYNKN
jgi:two-component sensor histidine kinase